MKGRWGDFQYLTRIIFCEMVGEDWGELIGYGISQQVHDGGDRVIVVDSKEGTVQLPRQPLVSFADYTQHKATW